MSGDLKVGAGTLSPGFSPGSLTVTGNLNLSPTTTLIEIGGTTAGTQFDVINVGGTANLGGTLNVVSWGGYTPTAGDTFNFLTFGSSTGSFATTNLPAAWGINLAPFASYLQLAMNGLAALPPVSASTLITLAPDALLPAAETSKSFDLLAMLGEEAGMSFMSLPEDDERLALRQCR